MGPHRLAEKVWRVPDTKTGAAHLVPLSDAALRRARPDARYREPANTDVVFPGAVRGTVISNSTCAI